MSRGGRRFTGSITNRKVEQKIQKRIEAHGGTYAPFENNGGSGNTNISHSRNAKKSNTGGSAGGGPPEPPNGGKLIVLSGISIKVRNDTDVDSEVLIGPEKSEEDLQWAKNQLKEMPQSARICNNLGCAYAFLYVKTRDDRFLKNARSSLSDAENATDVAPDIEATAKEIAKKNLAFIKGW